MSNQRTPTTTTPTHECGALANPRHYGETFSDPICHQPIGHTGCHIGTSTDGTRTGFHYASPAAPQPIKQTVKAHGGLGVLRLYVYENEDGRKRIARGKAVRGELTTVTVRNDGAWLTFHMDGVKIDGMGTAMKVWGSR